MKYVFVKITGLEAVGVVSSTVPADVHHHLGVLVTLFWHFVGSKPAHVPHDVGWFAPSHTHPLVEL